jgi:hypothetical protein
MCINMHPVMCFATRLFTAKFHTISQIFLYFLKAGISAIKIAENTDVFSWLF